MILQNRKLHEVNKTSTAWSKRSKK